jgi:hypothetical protein
MGYRVTLRPSILQRDSREPEVLKEWAIGMGTSLHRKMSRPNELDGTINVRKSERKE